MREQVYLLRITPLGFAPSKILATPLGTIRWECFDHTVDSMNHIQEDKNIVGYR